MRVLYVGGTGEISYSCVRRSVAVGQDVTVFNRGRRDEPLPEVVRRIVGDMADDAAYAALGAEQFDVVCQFLAYDVAAVERDVRIFGGNCGQYVFISTASAYQKTPGGYVITEATPLANPHWVYSRAKIAMERFLTERHEAGDIPVTIVRPSHTLRGRFPGGIASGHDWAWRILAGKPVIVQGDGSSLWTITHSADFAVPFVGLLGNGGAIGEDFHITRHLAGYTWDDIYTQVGEALGAETKIVHVPTDTLIRYKSDWAGPLLGDKTCSSLFDNGKVMSVVGEFQCTHALAEGFAVAAERHRQIADTFAPDAETHALLDRIIAEQSAMGTG